MKQPKPQPENYDSLITNINNGYIKIPKFQRDFVWSINDSADLLDSIIKGYPIGTFILWKTRERMGSVKELGSADLPPTPEGDFVQYVLDGQQRLASLFVVVKGLQVKKDNKLIDYSKIYVDLDKDIDSDEPIITAEKPVNNCITVYDLLSKNNISYFINNYMPHIDIIEDYRERFKTYDFSTIILRDYPIEAAVETFTRINTKGTELSLFEIMSAKTYDENKNFDLQIKYNELQENLENIGYDTIPSSTVLQCISMNLVGECTRKTILKLDKNKIIDVWDETVDSIKEAVDYFRTFYRIPASRLLPYNALIVPFSYFFYKNQDRPNDEQEKYLQEYFWRSSLSYRFSSAVETRLGQDVKKRINKIIKGNKPDYDFNVLQDKEEIKEWWFSTGDSYCKAILCLFAYFEPKSFNNNGRVILDNSALKQSNSRNFHHFFPRSYLEKKKIENANSIVNITLVDELLNKRKIRAKSPSKYMNEFKKNNPNLNKTMKSHLISNLDTFGIWDNDYERFLDKRSEKIVKELKKRIEI